MKPVFYIRGGFLKDIEFFVIIVICLWDSMGIAHTKRRGKMKKPRLLSDEELEDKTRGIRVRLLPSTILAIDNKTHDDIPYLEDIIAEAQRNDTWEKALEQFIEWLKIRKYAFGAYEVNDRDLQELQSQLEEG